MLTGMYPPRGDVRELITGPVQGYGIQQGVSSSHIKMTMLSPRVSEPVGSTAVVQEADEQPLRTGVTQLRTLRTDGIDLAPPVPMPLSYGEYATPIQIWEGTVQEVLSGEGYMRALLRAKIGQIPDHIADIELRSVGDQDRALIKPGAVFYLSLYWERRRGGTIRNAEELQFRRSPTWTARDVDAIKKAAAFIQTKGVPCKVAD